MNTQNTQNTPNTQNTQSSEQQAWYMKYKPRVIEDIIFPSILNEEEVGKERIKNIFEEMYNKGTIDGNILSYGPAGFGKTSLMDVMIKKIIKHPDDIFIPKKLNVESIEELSSWLQYAPKGSAQKIVKLEEADKLSREAQNLLKNGLMEKYQGRISFIANTNHPEKLDPALKTRFNYRLNFRVLPVQEVFSFIERILQNEGVTYAEPIEETRKELYEYVQKHIKIGLRDLINSVQVNVKKDQNGNLYIDHFGSISTSSNNEDYIIQVSEYLIKYAESIDVSKLEKVLESTTNDENFHKYYQAMLNVIKTDPFMDYDYIFTELLDKDFSLDVISTLSDNYQEIQNKIFVNQHFISSFLKSLLAIYRRRGGKIVFVN